MKHFTAPHPKLHKSLQLIYNEAEADLHLFRSKTDDSAIIMGSSVSSNDAV